MQLQCYDDAISWCEKGLAVSFITSCIYVLIRLHRDSSESIHELNDEKLCFLPLSLSLNACYALRSLMPGSVVASRY